MSWGWGYPWRRRTWPYYPSYPAPYYSYPPAPYVTNPEEELHMLEDYKRELEEELRGIQEELKGVEGRIAELKKILGRE